MKWLEVQNHKQVKHGSSIALNREIDYSDKKSGLSMGDPNIWEEAQARTYPATNSHLLMRTGSK